MDMMKKLGAAACSAAAACTALTATVFAEGEAAGSGQIDTTNAMLTSIVPFAIALVLLYFILLRPQQKREKQAQTMRENVNVGDEVCTAGGIVGIVLKVEDDTIVLETGAERNKIRIKKWAIHENITQVEAQQQADKDRKAARRSGIAASPAADSDTSKKKKKNADD